MAAPARPYARRMARRTVLVVAALVLGLAAGVAQAASSPVGMWKMTQNGRYYQWVAMPGGGFEERSMTVHRTATNKCLVPMNEPVYRYAPVGGGIYRMTGQFWRSDCTKHWEYESTVKVVATSARLTLSCDKNYVKVCYSYTRAKTDVTPPVVHALPSHGQVGGDTVLRYTVSDNSGKTWDELLIYRDGKLARKYKTTLGAAKAGRIYAYRLKQTPPDFAGTLRYCVVSHDSAGNASAPSCSTVTIAPIATATTNASPRSVALSIGDVVTVQGTHVGCYAITSSGKNGIACVLLVGGKPKAGTYGAGLAADGTAVLTRIKADGSGQQVWKRTPQARTKTYTLGVGDEFGMQLTSTVAIGCQVINVTSTLVEPLYRGIKVSCFRATSTRPVGNAWGISIADRFAGSFWLDAQGRTTTKGVVRKQPALS